MMSGMVSFYISGLEFFCMSFCGAVFNHCLAVFGLLLDRCAAIVVGGLSSLPSSL